MVLSLLKYRFKSQLPVNFTLTDHQCSTKLKLTGINGFVLCLLIVKEPLIQLRLKSRTFASIRLKKISYPTRHFNIGRTDLYTKCVIQFGITTTQRVYLFQLYEQYFNLYEIHKYMPQIILVLALVIAQQVCPVGLYGQKQIRSTV